MPNKSDKRIRRKPDSPGQVGMPRMVSHQSGASYQCTALPEPTIAPLPAAIDSDLPRCRLCHRPGLTGCDAPCARMVRMRGRGSCFRYIRAYIKPLPPEAWRGFPACQADDFLRGETRRCPSGQSSSYRSCFVPWVTPRSRPRRTRTSRRRCSWCWPSKRRGPATSGSYGEPRSVGLNLIYRYK